jgi:hypothetical protein
MIRVYFTPATTFGAPSSWIHIGNLLETEIAPGELRIAGPLKFPRELIPSPGHYCMIAVVTSAFDPAPDLACIATVMDYLDTVQNCNNIAYRNMDVVDLMTSLSSSMDVEVRNLHKQLPDTFDLQVEADQIIPGGKIRIYGPAEILDGAIIHGLKLIGRDRDINIYEILAGKELVKQRKFIAPAKSLDGFRYGFKRVPVKHEFRVKLEYVLPQTNGKVVIKKDWPTESMVRVKQLWQGKAVGGLTTKFRLPKPDQ